MKLKLPDLYQAALRKRPLRYLSEICGLSKDTIADVRNSQFVMEQTLIGLNKYFQAIALPELQWLTLSSTTDTPDITPLPAVALEGWELFHHIRRLFLAGSEDDALAVAFQASNSAKMEQWLFAGWGFLYVASGSGEPEHFAGVAKRLIHRIETEPCQLPPDLMYLMATDIAKFEAEYGRAAMAEAEYDQLIVLYPRFVRLLEPGQQVSTWRGHGTLKATIDRISDARSSYDRAAGIQWDTAESRAGNFYRMTQLALRGDSWHDYDRLLDKLWTEVADAVIAPRKTGLHSEHQISGISHPTLFNALLLNHARPEHRARTRQFQESLDEFVANLQQEYKLHRPIFQCRLAMVSLANEARNPHTRYVLNSFIRKQIEPGMAEDVHRLLQMLVRRLTETR